MSNPKSDFEPLIQKQLILPQNVVKAVSFLPAGICGEGEDGAAGTLQVTHKKAAVSIKPLGRQQLYGPADADELLTR